MSRENVELVREAYAAWNDAEVEAVLPFLHPEVEFVTSGTFLGLDPVYGGHDGFRRFWRRLPGHVRVDPDLG